MKRVLLALAVFAGAAGLLVSCSSGGCHDCCDGGHAVCAEPCDPVVVKKSVTTTTTTTECCEDAGCGGGCGHGHGGCGHGH